MANNDGKITLSLDTQKTAAQINADINKLQGQLKKVKATGALDTSPTVKQINAQISALQSQLKTIKINAEIGGNNASKTAREAGNNIAQNIADGISQAGGIVNSEVQKLADRAKEIAPSTNHEADTHQSQGSAAREAENQIQEIGKTGLSWIAKLKKAWKELGGEKLSASIRGKLLNKLQQIPKAVYEIDAAMTRLYKVTDETDSKYKQFLDSACDSAYRLGRSVSSLVELTADLADSGLSLEEAKQLANISSIYANVGGIDDNTAVSHMLTAMKAFNIQASAAITIVDKLSKLGNEYAASAASLGDGLSRSASAMAASGTDMDKTLAMLTSGGEITQNASEFGDFLKISSMRIRGMRDELAALGEETDDAVSSMGKVQAQILSLTGGQVNIFDNAGNARAYYDIMKDISKIYDDLSDANKADLTELLFGKQRGNQGAALIQAFQSGQIQNALAATLNAGGSAMEEQERWLESLEAKTRQFDAAFQSLSATILGSDLLKWFIDFGTGSVRVLDTIASTIGSLGTIGLGAGIFAGFKNVGSPKMSGLKNCFEIPTVC